MACPSVVLASLVGTAHEFEYGEMEPVPLGCAALCHSYLEPGSGLEQVEQAWLTTLSRQDTVGIVSVMCGSCHRSGGGYSAVMLAAHSDNNVYSPDSHGRKMSLAAPPPGTEAGVSRGSPDWRRGAARFGVAQKLSLHKRGNGRIVRPAIFK